MTALDTDLHGKIERIKQPGIARGIALLDRLKVMDNMTWSGRAVLLNLINFRGVASQKKGGVNKNVFGQSKLNMQICSHQGKRLLLTEII
jgi:hypothetical protein